MSECVLSAEYVIVCVSGYGLLRHGASALPHQHTAALPAPLMDGTPLPPSPSTIPLSSPLRLCRPPPSLLTPHSAERIVWLQCVLHTSYVVGKRAARSGDGPAGVYVNGATISTIALRKTNEE